MKLPGSNTITLSHEAVVAAVEAALNRAQGIDPPVRVVGMPSSGYRTMTFDVTTDPREREIPPPVPVPSPVLDVAAFLAASDGDETGAPEAPTVIDGGPIENGDTLL